MSKVSYIPKDYNSVTPYLIVKDAARPSIITRKFSERRKPFA
jgi:hypothetical protein